MNTATLTAPVRTIFREFPLALPEPMESQLARAGFAPWMLAPNWNEHRSAVRKLGEVKAYALMRDALRSATPCRGIGEVLWETLVTEVINYGDGVGHTEEKSQWKLVEYRREFCATQLANDLVEKTAQRARDRALNRKLKRLAT